MNRDVVQIQGKVINVYSGGKFEVLLDNGFTVRATVSGKMRKYRIRCFEGDVVLVEFSVYDLTNGRIVRRR